MKAFFGVGPVALLAIHLASAPLRADPPLLMVGSAGPVVDLGGGFTENTVVSGSARGLSVAFADLSELVPPVDGGTEFIPNAAFPGDVFRDASAYRVFRTAETVEVAADGGVMVQVRIGGSGPVLVSASGPTLAAAQAAALADAALDGIRTSIVATDAVSAAPTVTTTEATASALTGRDSYVVTVVTFGPAESIRTRGGNLGVCTTFVTGCDGGRRVTVDDDLVLLNTFALQDLYITDTLTRTATSVQNWFLNLTLEQGAVPPALTQGPVVQFIVGPQTSTLLASERGLNIPVDDLSDLAPVYNAGSGEERIVLNDGTGGTITSPEIPVRYGADGGAYSLADLDGEPSTAFTNSFGYRVTRTAATVEAAVDGGVRISARIGALGGAIASAVAPTFEAAQALLLADPALDGIRDAIAAMQAVAAAATVTTTEVTTGMLTGRDTYQVTAITFGPDTVRAGNLGTCATPITDCEGGTTVELPDGNTHFNTVTMQDLYITDTLTRTVTTVQNWFLELTLADPSDPPVLTEGPVVQFPLGPQASTLLASERGLSIPVEDLADLTPAYNDGTGETAIAVSNLETGTLGGYVPARYAADGGSVLLNDGSTEGQGAISSLESFGYRVFRDDATVEVAVDGGVSVQARIGSAGVALASAAGLTVEAARALLLADAALDGIRGLIVAAELVAVAPTATVAEATSAAITGRDTYLATDIRFGPATIRAGNLGACPNPLTDCEGGTQVTLPNLSTNFNLITLQDLYITDTLTRTVTTVQNWFLELTLADPADPPVLTEGPPVQFPGGPVESELFASERGLAIPVVDLADLAPVYRIGDVETQITLNDGSGGQGVLGPEFAARYAPDGGSYDLGQNPDSDETPVANAFGYRLFRTDRTIEVAVDGGNAVQARVGTSGPVLASASGPTLEAARAVVLADSALDGIRADIVATQIVAAAPTVTTTEATTSLLTGRDTYAVTAITFGPQSGLGVGNLGECTTPLTDCEGGTQVTIGVGATHYNTVTLQDLYITDTLTRTVTTVQNWFLELILFGGDAAPHVGAQAVGFEAGEGFLARLEDEAGAGGAAVTVSTSGAAPTGPARLRFFAGVSGGSGSFDRIGGVEDSDWNASGLTGGFAYALSPEWTVGAGIEAGRWSWSGEGAGAEGDSRKVGLFAAWSRGPWQVTLAGFAGQQDVETEDALGITADYEADVRGASVVTGYAIAAGDWTITPTAGVRWLRWDAPRVTDSAGGVVEAARVDQWRPELGVSARRSFALDSGRLDFSIDARVWTVEGDRTAVLSGGVLTEGPETGRAGGSLGVSADWQVAPGAVLSARIETRFSDDAPSTRAGIGLRMRF